MARATMGTSGWHGDDRGHGDGRGHSDDGGPGHGQQHADGGWAEPWAMEAGEVARSLGVRLSSGLSTAEAAKRLADLGKNALPEGTERPAIVRLAAQFANTSSAVLAAAAGVTAALGNFEDTGVIGAVVVLDATVGFVQEGRAAQALAALREMSVQNCRARRDARTVVVPVSSLVPGDVVLVEQGDVVPADIRLTEVHSLRVHEAALTGEAEPVPKTTDPTSARPAAVAERECMAYKGTAVTHGRATGVVTATGMRTEIGRIAELLEAHRQPLTPLQARLAVLGRRLAAFAVAVCAAVFAIGSASGEPVHKMFLTAVSLAVAAIPEGLPAVVTVALALGARRMAVRHAIVRRLPAVETLGSVTVICTDKTGTLTANQMVVERVWTPSGTYRVTGDGYAPDGEVVPDPPPPPGRAARPWRPEHDPALVASAEVAAACNDATLHAPGSPGRPWSVVGDPTEGALLAFAGKVGVDGPELARHRPRRAEIGFDPQRRRMTTFHADGDGMWVAVKGAPAAVFALVGPGGDGLATRAEAVAERWAADGLRVLALAQQRLPALPADLHAPEEGLLELVGLVAMTDPPRPQAVEAIARCRHAGITPVMITGDHPLTAAAIAQRIGLSQGADVCTGTDLDHLDDPGLGRLVAHTSVYARVTPEQKLRIVQAWKANRAVVAMTGDGVNDAPALRLADIGVAMGVTGTDVSKEAADMVLADDNFATIVSAVEEGRRIYDNIRRFVRYLLSTNSAEVLVMIAAPLVGLPLPLLAVQILWVNLVTDGAPAIALGLEPAEPDVLSRPPRPPGEPVLGAGLASYIAVAGTVMAAIAIAVEAVARSAGWHWQTMVFSSLALMQLAGAWAMRSRRTRHGPEVAHRRNRWLLASLIGGAAAQLALVYVPVLQDLFRTRALGPAELAVVVVAAAGGYLSSRLTMRLVPHKSGPAPARADPAAT